MHILQIPLMVYGTYYTHHGLKRSRSFTI